MSDEPPPPRLVRLGAELTRERDNTRRLTAEARAALDDLSDRLPSSLELRGAGDVVHDYYSGLEKAFVLIAETVDGGVPVGERWHRRLLDSMTLEMPGLRPALLRGQTAVLLDPFLKFRHVFRNIYGFDLDWERVRALLERVGTAQALFEEDLDAFKSALGLWPDMRPR